MLLVCLGAIVVILLLWWLMARIPPVPYTLDESMREGIDKVVLPFGKQPTEPMGQNELPHGQHPQEHPHSRKHQ